LKHPLNSPEKKIKEKGIEIGRNIAKTASKLGAHTINVVPGNHDPEMDHKKALELSALSLKKIGEFPKDVGIKVGVEEV